MKTSLICVSVLTALASAPAVAVSARDGYMFDLKLTTANAPHDPDRVWSDTDISAISAAGLKPKIYTARITTPSGQWLLSQLAGFCNMQGMCDTLLVRIKPGEMPVVYANPQVSEGGHAELSLNYKKLTTLEIDPNGRSFKGTYDVAPLK